MAGVFVAFMVLFACGSPRAAEKEAVRPSVGELIRAFETVVFGWEFNERTLRGRSTLWRWEGPLRVAVRSFSERETKMETGATGFRLVQEQVNDGQLGLVQKHLKTLVRLTELKTEDANKGDETPNIVINFVPRYQMANPVLADMDIKILRRLASHGGCYFALWPEKDTKRISRAVIVVNVDRIAAHIDHCILEELTQSLGMPNDIDVKWPSVFADRFNVTELSRSDEIIIRTLYHPDLQAGMDRKEAMRHARRIIAEMDRTLP